MTKQDLKEWKSCLVGEYITGDQSTASIEHFLLFLCHAYYAKFEENLRFRIIVLDFCWATMHAVVHQLNRESIESYAHAVLEYSQAPLEHLPELAKKRTFISSCAAHTMHRFVRSIKPLTSNSDIIQLASYSFSLLLNSTELEILKEIFTLIVIVFMSKERSLVMLDALSKLNDLINQRPTEKEDILKIIHKVSFGKNNIACNDDPIPGMLA